MTTPTERTAITLDKPVLLDLKIAIENAALIEDETIEAAILAAADKVQARQLDREQCSAMSNNDGDPVRCELEPGHSPYTRRIYGLFTPGGFTEDPSPYDHAAPDYGLFWMDRR